MDSMDVAFWSGLQRFLETNLAASPTIVIGLVTAAVFQWFFGVEGTQRVFAGHPLWGLFKAWLLGMLLPVCTLGALPLCSYLKRCGVSSGNIVALALSAPLFNPLSLLYGLTLSDPIAILTFAMCSLLMVTVVCWVWERTMPAVDLQSIAPEQGTSPVGMRRLIAILNTMAREAAGPSLLWLLLTAIGVGVLGAALPVGFLQRAANVDRPLAPIVMALVMIPAYATPLAAMGELGSMFQHGNHIGAGFTLLIVGAGITTGTLVWIAWHYGVGRCVLLMAILMPVVLGFAYALAKPLYPRGVEVVDHTHAFDRYCQPPGMDKNPATWCIAHVRQQTPLQEWVGAAVLGCFVIAGTGLRWCDRTNRLHRWSTSGPAYQPDASTPWHQRPVSPPVIGAAILVGLVAFSIVGCYAYYPATDEAYEELKVIHAEAVSSSIGARLSIEVAERNIAQMEDWVRRLQVGIYIRRGWLDPNIQQSIDDLLDALERLEDSLETAEETERRRLGIDVSTKFTRLGEITQEAGLRAK
jgi:uncharacterized protein